MQKKNKEHHRIEMPLAVEELRSNVEIVLRTVEMPEELR